jgi:hypothetical protein
MGVFYFDVLSPKGKPAKSVFDLSAFLPKQTILIFALQKSKT